ncbi:DUF3107 domain-containing protein [Actinotalea sp. Marseille-Q4924]|uniref:DUF3107 domain-containing protein n=1 Tax=Actinotalea sp. Marseille-Q4924 TaxID=2866571 RepID=UPI001CE43DF6|nr:DUF3107 domain-containing protein [Actinotalea sp. Marseille-Q4924]
MEITIGVQNVGRELVFETDKSADEVSESVAQAIEAGAALRFTDTRGRHYLVPSATVAYVEIGSDETRRVGFHNI